MSNSNDWFEVDRAGLAKVLARRGQEFALFELVQNAWDEPGVTTVVATLKTTGHGLATFTITDDAPDGFKDLTHAYRMFAESAKKQNPEQRGRFNFGEKLVFAMAKEAKVKTTTGTIHFDENGRHRRREASERGSEVSVTFRMNREEVARAIEHFNRLLVPSSIRMTVNEARLVAPTPVAEFDCVLPTEVANADGQLVRKMRKTTVRAYAASEGAPAAIYEMGIPVCEIDGPWWLDIGQKVPLTMDRENVSEAFKKALSLEAFNALHHLMPNESFAATWVKQATENPEASPAAVTHFVRARFGEKVVSFDPSDPEANKLAVAAGYVVLPGGTFTGPQWENIRATGFVKPAGKVTPSAKGWDGDGAANAKDCPPIPEQEWTEEMRMVAEYATKVALVVLEAAIRVEFYSSVHMLASATYGPGTLSFNKQRLGNQWFDMEKNRLKIDDLLIHEFGHHYAGDHLSENYYRALTSIAARFIAAVRKGLL
jgi:hypothetical protein